MAEDIEFADDEAPAPPRSLRLPERPPVAIPDLPDATADPGPAPVTNLPPFQIPGMGGDTDVSRLLTAVAPHLQPIQTQRGPKDPTAGSGGLVGRPPNMPPQVDSTTPPGMPGPPLRRVIPEPPKPVYRDPITALSQPLTALAMLASLFTRTPATTALNAAAGAMDAQKRGDQQAYLDANREYQQELQKVSTEQNIENAEYQRDFENRRLSMQERLARMRGTATRRGDGAMLSVLDSNGDPGALLDARIKAGKPISESLIKAAAIKEKIKANPNLSIADAAAEYEHEKAEAKKTGKPMTMANQKAQAIEDLMLANPNLTRAQAIQQVESKNTRSGMTGNQRVKEQQKVTAIEESLGKIDGAMSVLNRYRLAAGPAGAVLRGKEVVGNIFGNNETDREQFKRDIEYLKLMFPRLVSQGGRPLAADAKRVDNIIGGLSLGDTTANTLRSLEELQQMYLRMYKGQQDILETPQGPPQGDQPTPAGPRAKPSDGVDWDAFPKAQ